MCERERAVLFFLRSVFLASNEAVRQPYFLVSSVTSEKLGRRDRRYGLFLPPRHAGCLPHYPLERHVGERHYFKTCFLYRGTMSVNYCAVLLGSCFLTFRRNVPSSSSELRVCELTQTWRWYVFRNVRKNYVITWHNNPKDLVHNNHVVESSSYCYRTDKNIFIISLCSSLIVSRYMSGFVWENWTINFSWYLGASLHECRTKIKGSVNIVQY